MPPLSDMVCSCVFLSATSHRLLVYTVPKMILLVLPHSHVPFPIFKELTLLMSHRFYLNAMHASYMHRSAKPGSRCPLSVRRCPRSGRPRFFKKEKFKHRYISNATGEHFFHSLLIQLNSK